MKKTNPIFTLKNFRSFGEEGADFELAPITVLTGCNSAGKSSLVKALMLLAKQPTDGTVGDLGGNRKMPSLLLKASSRDLMLGGYNNLVHKLNKDGKIEMSYSIWSSFLHEEVICRRVFHAKKGVMNDGALSFFSVEKKDGTIVYRGLPDNSIVILENGEEACFDYVSEEEHFDAIRTNYERFVAACDYALYAAKKQRIEAIKSRKDGVDWSGTSDLYNRLVDMVEQGKLELKECGMTIEEAEGYDMDAFRQWRRSNYSGDDTAELRAYKEEMTAEEKEELRQQVFYTSVVNEVVSPWFFGKLASIDSSTNKISRVYNVEDNDKFAALLCDIISRTAAYKYRSNDFVNKWLKLFGIGDSIEIEGDDASYGVRVFVVKGDERTLLADEGCGLTQIVSLLLQIAAMRKRHSEKTVDDDFHEVTLYDDSVICIEEPEVHLHPKYQSMLAELFVEAYQKYNIHFIIETHSEYLIRKLQVLVASKENALTANDVSLNYVEKGESGVSTNRKIGITEDGRLMDSFGEGFFDEAGGLSRQLLKLNM